MVWGDRLSPQIGFGAPQGAAGLQLLAGLDVPAGLGGAAEAAVGLLLLVLDLDLREVQRDLVGRQDVAVPAAARLVRRDEQLLQLDHHERLLLAAGLPAGQGGLLDVLAAGAREHELGRGLAALHHEVEVLHRDLAGAAAAAAAVRTLLRLAPAPRLDVDLALVPLARGLAVDAVELQIIVNRRHTEPPSEETRRSRPRPSGRADGG